MINVSVHILTLPQALKDKAEAETDTTTPHPAMTAEEKRRRKIRTVIPKIQKIRGMMTRATIIGNIGSIEESTVLQRRGRGMRGMRGVRGVVDGDSRV